MKSFTSFITEAESIHRIHNGDVVRGTYMNVPYTGFVATQKIHPTNHDIRIFTVRLDKPIVVHGSHLNVITVNGSDNPSLSADRIALREAKSLPHTMLIAVPKNPHQGDGKGYWKVGDDVYRASVEGPKDAHGAPLDKRWESSLTHFQRYFDSVHAQHYVKAPEWK